MSIFKSKKTKEVNKSEVKNIAKNQTGEGEKSFILAKKNKNIAAYRLIVKPILTEKATDMEARSKYVFMVENKANKVEIKKAIELLYNVRPIKINIIKVSGKRVRSSKGYGVTKKWRKAIVTLRPSEKIEYTKAKI